jgi:putative addiction module component (TIGR02574 family)
MATSDDFVDRALGLPETQRAELAEKLLWSLEPASSDPSLDDHWRVEIESRLTRLREGTAETSSWDDAAARIRQAVAKVHKS